ncbi:MAG: phage tail protein I [Clostridiales bacterium]|nr:phage tail protein I [Clostridiales bacterium]
MNDSRLGITRENLLLIVPPALTHDPAMMARAAADAEALAARLAEIDRVRIISNIDELPEELLDILAYDFKVDWWDPEYTLEEKRRTLKDSWRVHKLLGTKAAVETAISAIYPNTKVLEWFEYGGEPYHFRLDINITDDSMDSDKQRRVLERVNFYKSLRSHNDGITYFVEAAPAEAKAMCGVPGLEETAYVAVTLPVPILRPTAQVRAGGGAVATQETMSTQINL